MKIENGTLISVDEKDIVDGRFHLPGGVQTIGKAAFSRCTGLTHLTIPEGVTIGEEAFEDYTGLTHLTISEGVTIGKAAFAGCTGLTHLTISEDVTIGEIAFEGCCTGLTHLTISAGVTIGKCVFLDCTRLTYLTISEGVTIGEAAFARCTDLIEITLDGELVYIADSAFNDCDQLNKIWIYSDDEAEIKRIKRPVPEALQCKCEKHPLYKEIEGMRKTALESLFVEPKTSDAFVIHRQKNGFFNSLPGFALLEIDKFLGDESYCYRQAEKEMRSQPAPTQEKDLASYENTLEKIIDKYKKIAKKHKPDFKQSAASKATAKKRHKSYHEQGTASNEQKGGGGAASSHP